MCSRGPLCASLWSPCSGRGAAVRRAVAKFEQRRRPSEKRHEHPRGQNVPETGAQLSLQQKPRPALEEAPSSREGQAGKTSARPQVVKEIALYLRSQTPKRRGSSEQILRTAAKRHWDMAGYSNLSRDEVEKAIFLGSGKRVPRTTSQALVDVSSAAPKVRDTEPKQGEQAPVTQAAQRPLAAPAKDMDEQRCRQGVQELKQPRGAWGRVVDALRSERPVWPR
ncbi:unnamed protein product [Symbiodinium pilosum]|uniref:Uncharacterized protein n=1 Tax=Symbiodinium pilosum TaxID=2952 RepID=A0A812WC14_SYMPI|nr:unnamed protein product [Symbiodinium pilosum]